GSGPRCFDLRSRSTIPSSPARLGAPASIPPTRFLRHHDPSLAKVRDQTCHPCRLATLASRPYHLSCGRFVAFIRAPSIDLHWIVSRHADLVVRETQSIENAGAICPRH